MNPANSIQNKTLSCETTALSFTVRNIRPAFASQEDEQQIIQSALNGLYRIFEKYITEQPL